jgi:2-oxoglutarate ferredoxin oxidoreductase subunit alpha
LWPFPKEAIAKACDKVKGFLTVEMSMGQMLDDVRLAVAGRKPVEFFGRTGGIVPTPAEVVEAVKAMGEFFEKFLEGKQ